MPPRWAVTAAAPTVPRTHAVHEWGGGRILPPSPPLRFQGEVSTLRTAAVSDTAHGTPDTLSCVGAGTEGKGRRWGGGEQRSASPLTNAGGGRAAPPLRWRRGRNERAGGQRENLPGAARPVCGARGAEPGSGTPGPHRSPTAPRRSVGSGRSPGSAPGALPVRSRLSPAANPPPPILAPCPSSSAWPSFWP